MIALIGVALLMLYFVTACLTLLKKHNGGHTFKLIKFLYTWGLDLSTFCLSSFIMQVISSDSPKNMCRK